MIISRLVESCMQHGGYLVDSGLFAWCASLCTLDISDATKMHFVWAFSVDNLFAGKV